MSVDAGLPSQATRRETTTSSLKLSKSFSSGDKARECVVKKPYVYKQQPENLHVPKRRSGAALKQEQKCVFNWLYQYN